MLRKLTINQLGQNTLITLLQIKLELGRDDCDMEWVNKQINIAINTTKGVVGMTQNNRIKECLDAEEVENYKEGYTEDER